MYTHMYGMPTRIYRADVLAVVPTLIQLLLFVGMVLPVSHFRENGQRALIFLLVFLSNTVSSFSNKLSGEERSQRIKLRHFFLVKLVTL